LRPKVQAEPRFSMPMTREPAHRCGREPCLPDRHRAFPWHTSIRTNRTSCTPRVVRRAAEPSLLPGRLRLRLLPAVAAVARVAVAAVGVPEPPEQRLPVGALVHPAVRVVELQLLPANRSRGLRTT